MIEPFAKFQQTLFQCSRCLAVSPFKHVVQKHTHRKAGDCLNADVRQEKVWLVRAGVPSLVCNTPPNAIVPAQTEEEDDASIDVLFSDQNLLKKVMKEVSIECVPATLFKETKSALQNIRVESEYVIEYREGGEEVRVPKQKYCREEVLRLLELLEVVCKYSVSQRSPEYVEEAYRRIREIRHASFIGPRMLYYSRIDAAKMYVTNNGDFHRVLPPGLKAEIKRMADNVRRELNTMHQVLREGYRCAN